MQVQNPCIKVCQQDENGICQGCFRTNDEIIDWYDMKPAEQLKVRQEAIIRKNEARGDSDYYGFQF